MELKVNGVKYTQDPKSKNWDYEFLPQKVKKKEQKTDTNKGEPPPYKVIEEIEEHSLTNFKNTMESRSILDVTKLLLTLGE